jgi:diguanylate cyclase (GGDEF)-like protein/PAS domain S-box-containing protein
VPHNYRDAYRIAGAPPERADAGVAESLLGSGAVGIAATDRELRYVAWNRFMETLTGLPAEEVLGRSALDVYPRLRERGLPYVLRRVLHGESVTAPDAPVRLPAGREGWVSAHFSPRLAEDGSVAGVVGVLVDVTARKEAEAERRAAQERLRHDARHDPLTGLPNRALFLERLAAAAARDRASPGGCFAVLVLDLDRFQLVNDSLGHAVGDALLACVAERLRGCVRDGDTVARLGGDEFVVLLDDRADARVATHAAERIHATLARPLHPAGHEVFTSASIGIALSAAGYGEPQHLVRNAELAMYRARRAGAGRHATFDAGMHAGVLARLELETDLRRAAGRGELSLVYQPIVALDSGRVAGFEALLRWLHPTRGWVPPDEFIPVAEDTGLILPLGCWVVAEACRRLRAMGPRISISVNVSARQLAQPELPRELHAALGDAGVAPERLIVEVTESGAVGEAAAATLARVRALGVRVYMDDFGTGYSSLAALHRLPIDGLKVDRSFVAGITDAGSGTIEVVRTVAALARGLGLPLIAEGVETPAQLAALRGLGCQFAQGFLFAPGLEPAAAADLLAANPRW